MNRVQQQMDTGPLVWMGQEGKQEGQCNGAVDMHGTLPWSKEQAGQGQTNIGDVMVNICYRPPDQQTF